MQWYGIAATGSARIGGKAVSGIRPVQQQDGSGFCVSPTSPVDRTVTGPADQRRDVNPLRVASAGVPASVLKAGIGFGSFGVAVDTRKQLPRVPFVVARRWRGRWRACRSATRSR